MNSSTVNSNARRVSATMRRIWGKGAAPVPWDQKQIARFLRSPCQICCCSAFLAAASTVSRCAMRMSNVSSMRMMWTVEVAELRYIIGAVAPVDARVEESDWQSWRLPTSLPARLSTVASASDAQHGKPSPAHFGSAATRSSGFDCLALFDHNMEIILLSTAAGRHLQQGRQNQARQ